MLLLLVFGALLGLVCAATEGAETYSFQSETAKLMDIIVNSLYSNRDIFLRELLSNAADALEKARFVALKSPGLLGEGETAELKTRVWFDVEKGELYIQDSGIGMDRTELVENLGTIAESGTRRFLEQQGQSADATTDLIGQFGVGFFSAFLVADEVYVDTVRTRKSEDDTEDPECLRWSSTAVGTFTIESIPEERESIVRGTRLTLKMKDNALEYLDFDRLRGLIMEHSKFLPFPIYLRKAEEVDVPVEPQPEEQESEEVSEEPKETRKEIKYTWEHINNLPVLWLRDKQQITKDEYKDFFKNGGLGRNYYEDPAGWIHFKGEGLTDYTALIYIPKSNPLYFLFRDGRQRIPGLRLYINRVYVTDNLNIVPEYLPFATGILDTDNKLTINLSREMIQHSRQMAGIGRKITKKVFEWMDASSRKDEKRWEKFQRQLREHQDALEEYEEELKQWEAKRENADAEVLEDDNSEEQDNKPKRPEAPEMPSLDYCAFYANYGDYLKFGITKDDENKNSLIKSLRYPSSYTVEKYPQCIPDLKEPYGNVVKPETVATFTTFKQYIKRMEKKNEQLIQQMKEDFDALEEEAAERVKREKKEEKKSKKGSKKDKKSEEGDALVEHREFDKSQADPYIQKDIYYFTAPSFSEALTSPIMEQANALGLEVLYFTNPIDMFIASPINSVKGHKLVDISEKDVNFPKKYRSLELDDEDNKENTESSNRTNDITNEESEAAKLLKKFLSEELEENVQEIQFSKRLTSSPALLTLRYGNAAFRRIAESSVDAMTRTSMRREKYIMEINLHSPIIRRLTESLSELNEADSNHEIVATDAMRRYAHALFDAAKVQSGFVVDDLRSFSERVYGLLEDSLKAQ